MDNRVIIDAMTRTTKLLIGVFVAILVLIVGSYVAVKALLSDSTKQKVLAKASSVIGVPIQVGSISIDFGAWMKLQPTLSLEKVVVGNPRGFQSPNMIEAEVVEAKVGLRSLTSDSPEIHSARIVRPLITVERNAAGETNLQAFLKGLSSTKPASPAQPVNQAPDNSGAGAGGGSGISIETFDISEGQVKLVGIAAAGGDVVTPIRNFNYHLEGFGPGKALTNHLDATLYEGKNSKLTYDGIVGPVTESALPLKGKVDLVLAPAELPRKVVQDLAGEMLSDPGPDARVELQVDLGGDLYGSTSGPMQLAFSNLKIGPDPKKALPLSGKTSGQFALSQLLSTPAYSLTLPDAALSLGKGNLKSKMEFASDAQGMRGTSAGSIGGIDVREFLGAFSKQTLQVSGLLSVPRYNLSFSGKTPDDVVNNLKMDGDLKLANGRLEALDLITNIKNAVDNPKMGVQQGAGKTEFADLSAQFAIANQVIRISNAVMNATAAKVNGNGTVTFNQMLNFKLEAAVTGQIAKLLGKPADEAAIIPVSVTGPAANPQVKPDTARLARDAGINYATKYAEKYTGSKEVGDVIQGLFGGKKKKK